MPEIEFNSHGVNRQIKYHVLPDDTMRKIGFTDHNPKTWYFCCGLGEDITFNVTIPKNGIDDIRIDVLDEWFLQPYDYQYLLSENPKFSFALSIKKNVEKQMAYLQDAGVISGFEKGMYI